MRGNMLAAIFAAIFLAELGDRIQLATLLFACDRGMSRLGVFVAAGSALLLSTLIAVLIGYQVSSVVPPKLMRTLEASASLSSGYGCCGPA
jgi:putative Ca2+/H+ antiporter (TMEM165/GDT1 family)